jgi:carbonic anhydrase
VIPGFPALTMKRTWRAILLTGLGLLSLAAAASEDADKLSRMLQHSTLALLKEGNARFVAGKPLHPHQDLERRGELATAGQEPLATILACSDSREPVELIFDRGVGDLFVIRVAGNVAGVSELATMEYGVTHLGTPLLVVLGHSQCGAVTAVVKGAELHGHLPALAALIQPAAEKAKVEAEPEEILPVAIRNNVWEQIGGLLRSSALLREAAAGHRVQIVGAIYDIATGKIEWLGQHPQLQELVAAPSPAHAPMHTHAEPEAASEPSPAPAHPVVKVEAPKYSAVPPPTPTLVHQPSGSHH